jgi:hypothetical protein
MLKKLVKMHYNEIHLIVDESVTQRGQVIFSGHKVEQVFKWLAVEDPFCKSPSWDASLNLYNFILLPQRYFKYTQVNLPFLCW